MTTQKEIIEALGVPQEFDAQTEAERRIGFLMEYLRSTGLRTLVLGISGGVDSTTAAMLAQRAVSRLRDEGYDAQFVAVRLPYGTQADEREAQAALDAIAPDRAVTVNIKPAVDATWAQIKAAGVEGRDFAHEDFLRGNVKARERMIVQFAIAGALRGIVIGTDHAAEAVMGFFTKFGDGAADILPLAGLNKRRVRAIAALLGAPQALVMKVPTADLEDGAPLKPDEDAHGVTYEQIDDFLEGREVEPRAHDKIIATYRATAHKRALPVAANEYLAGR